MKTKLKIDVISDVVCPWCTVGFKHLEKAISDLGLEDKVDIEWQPFELNPYTPKDGQDLEEYMTNKYGTNTHQQEEGKQRLIDFGKKVDFKFDFFEGMRIVNTFDAHVLLEYAKEFNKQTELKMRLTTSYFSERKDVSKIDILKEALHDVGLNADEGISKLKDENIRDKVKGQEQYWQKMGVKSVPTFVFNHTEGVSGAQPIDTFKSILNKMI